MVTLVKFWSKDIPDHDLGRLLALRCLTTIVLFANENAE
jgi:hypothetical protein